jgi:hypothetical protein
VKNGINMHRKVRYVSIIIEGINVMMETKLVEKENMDLLR